MTQVHISYHSSRHDAQSYVQRLQEEIKATGDIIPMSEGTGEAASALVLKQMGSVGAPTWFSALDRLAKMRTSAAAALPPLAVASEAGVPASHDML